MYMAGRFRTASMPPSTLMLVASYLLSSGSGFGFVTRY